MASWFGTLESVVRLYNAAVFLTVLFALTAAASGVASFWLSRRAAALKAEQTARELTMVREEVREQIAAQESELEQSRQAVEKAEARAEGFLDRIEALEAEISKRAARASEPRPVKPRPAPAETVAPAARIGAISAEQGALLTRLLAGKASGAITLVAISGDRGSMAAARLLASLLTDAGWTPEVIEAFFPSRPDGLIFVVHSREAIPDRQYVLAQAMAEAGLLTLPVKMIVNPARPAGFLGLLVGTPSQ